MKFEIRATSIWRDEHEQIPKAYPILKEFGYDVEERESDVGKWTYDENGKQIFQVSDKKPYYVPYIEIDSLDRLLELSRALGEENSMELIVSPDGSENMPYIEIYDSWRE